ncbi:MAG: rRNA methyltransferase [Sulfuricurvum sp. PC08-66]|nr:MAG: rRNA methyltransferase [Sulfuricurvum sp. PC08-66]
MLQLTPVEDVTLPELALYHKFRDSAFASDESFIADSPKVVNLLLQSTLEIKSILATPAYYAQHEELIARHDIPVLYVAEKSVLEVIAGVSMHHNCMMHAIKPSSHALEALDAQVVMLDSIASSENIGLMARSAAALGIGSYVLPARGPHPFGRRALRVSMGYASRLKIHIYEDIFGTLAHLKSLGYTIIAAEITPDARPLSSIEAPLKWVLLMGSEDKGISAEVLACCDAVVAIEMAPEVKSLNVGVAASIMMYQLMHKA